MLLVVRIMLCFPDTMCYRDRTETNTFQILSETLGRETSVHDAHVGSYLKSLVCVPRMLLK
jgi:hypothetical protein